MRRMPLAALLVVLMRCAPDLAVLPCATSMNCPYGFTCVANVCVVGAEADAGDACLPPTIEALRADIVRVGFEGDLGVTLHTEEVVAVLDESADAIGFQEARSAPAEVNGVHRCIADLLAALDQFRSHGIKNTMAVLRSTEVEIAVRAGSLAERYVEVDAGHVGRSWQ